MSRAPGRRLDRAGRRPVVRRRRSRASPQDAGVSLGRASVDAAERFDARSGAQGRQLAAASRGMRRRRSRPRSARRRTARGSAASRPRGPAGRRRDRCRARSASGRRTSMPSLRPVSGDAHRIEQRRFEEHVARCPRVQPVGSPPITPPRPARRRRRRSPSSSGRARSSCRSSAASSRRRAPARTARSPASLSASNTCSGRPRSKVKKLVMSTSAEIGRSPIASQPILQPVRASARSSRRG